LFLIIIITRIDESDLAFPTVYVTNISGKNPTISSRFLVKVMVNWYPATAIASSAIT